MTRRAIVEIDEAKCDGCGLCVPSCAEGAIQIIDGKAKLVADMYCDGLGACLGECPRGAIDIIERDAAAFDEAAVHHRQAAKTAPKPPAFAGCPGAAVRNLQINALPAATAGQPGTGPFFGGKTRFAGKPSAENMDLSPSASPPAPALTHWPIQLHLVPPHAPFLRDADLFLVADCVPFACADFHERILRRRPILIGCPKLDDAGAYVAKLADIFRHAGLRSLTVVHMEVPCCTKLLRIAEEALQTASSSIPLTEITVSVRGEILYGAFSTTRH